MSELKVTKCVLLAVVAVVTDTGPAETAPCLDRRSCSSFSGLVICLIYLFHCAEGKTDAGMEGCVSGHIAILWHCWNLVSASHVSLFFAESCCLQ